MLSDAAPGLRAMTEMIVNIVEQQGQHDFPTSSMDSNNVAIASLCGLTVALEQDGAIRIRANDVDLYCDCKTLEEPANDEPVAIRRDSVVCNAVRFLKGGEEELKFWYNHLLRLHDSFDYSKQVQPI